MATKFQLSVLHPYEEINSSCIVLTDRKIKKCMAHLVQQMKAAAIAHIYAASDATQKLFRVLTMTHHVEKIYPSIT